MVNFEDDLFAPMVQDGVSSSSSKPSSKSSSSGSSRHNKASSRSLKSSKSGRRTSSRSLESRGSSHDSGGGGGSGSGGKSSSSSRHRSSRRTGSSREGSSRDRDQSSDEKKAALADEPDYGYGSQDDSVDYGYGEPVEQQPQQPQRSRRQRRCSIADVMSTDESGEDVDPVAAFSRSNQKTSDRQSNIAIPMGVEESKKQPRARRGSIMGLGFEKPTKEPERKQKKPGVDRDRRRQGTLMDRVGAGR